MAFDYSMLKGKIKEKFDTQDAFAKELGIGRVSLSMRLNNKLEFSQKEMEKSCILLSIDICDLAKYFFCPKSSETRTI